jgi:hypothetical protein
MKLSFDARRAITWAFILLSVGSSVSLVLGARSYFLFYSALDRVQFTVGTMHFQRNSSASDVQTLIIAQNPVDYSGLKVTLLSIAVYFESSNSSMLFQNATSNLRASRDVEQNIAANTNTSWSLVLPLNSNQTLTLSAFYDRNYPNITAHVSLSVSVSTFLNSVQGGPLMLQTPPQNTTLT